MSEIPEDIKTAAQDCWRAMGFVNDRHDQTKFIARAILAERERWKPAVEYFDRYCQDEADDDDFPERFRQQHEDAKAFKAVVRNAP